MEMTLRWYGSKSDSVTLQQIRQIPESLPPFMKLLPATFGNVKLFMY